MAESIETLQIGFLGGGAMAEALAGGLVAAGVPAHRIVASDPVPERRDTLASELGVRTTASNDEAVRASDVVVLAVKPGLVVPVLEGLDPSRAGDLERPLWLSIAAGLPLARLAGALPKGARAIRAMPNTPALVRAGATALAANEAATELDRRRARTLFETVGRVWEAPDEGLLDAVTGLSGSGPAYVFVFLEALGDAGVRMGLPREAANELAFQTVFGAAKLALDLGVHPASLKDRVTSPGGTTMAGLERLEAGGVREAVYEAVRAATLRSRELAAK